MKDNIPYSADDLLSLCKSIDSQADKTTIYNVTYKMKVANYIRSTEDKKYIKIPIAEKETVSLNDKVNDAIACIQKALSSYQSFNWLNCSESELLSTRQTFKALKKTFFEYLRSILKKGTESRKPFSSLSLTYALLYQLFLPLCFLKANKHLIFIHNQRTFHQHTIRRKELNLFFLTHF